MNLFSRLATATGQSMLAGQQYEQAQADLEYKQQAAAMQKMQMMAARQKMETDKIVGEQIQAEFGKDNAAVSDPAKAAEVYSKAARTAIQRNDFEGARSFEAMAQSELTRARTAADNLRAQQKERAEALANSAANFQANPTPESAQTVVRSALAAGVPMKDIPDMRSPKFATWAKEQQTAGMTARERLAEKDRVRAHEEDLEYKKKEAEWRHEEARRKDRQTALFQAGILEIRRDQLKLSQDKFAAKGGAGGSGDLAGIGKVEMTHRGQAIGAGVQAVRQVEQLALGFQPGAQLGPFASLKPGSDIASSLKLLGGTALTPPAAQAMQAVTANLAKNVGNLLTAVEGGRAPTDSQIKAMQVALAPAAGENVLVSAFKIKNATEEIEAGLRGAKHSDPEKEKQRQETLEKLKSIMPGVSSLDILKAIQSSKNTAAAGQLVKFQSDYNSAMGALGLGGSTPASAPAATPKPTPSGKPMSVDEWLSK